MRLKCVGILTGNIKADADGEFGAMAVLKDWGIDLVPLKTLARIVRKVPENSQLVHTA
ncbi:MAG: hypothetical protein VB778_00240 [Nitrospinaceae bacterium]